MPVDDFPPSLQESILAALLFDERSGAAIASQVNPALFDDGYREIAERALAYRRKYRKAPGRAHLDDLFGALLTPGRAPRLRRTVFDLAELFSEGINGEYILSRTQDYIRQQTYKRALVEANSRFEQGGDGVANDIEGIFTSAIRFRSQTLEAGTRLNDTKRSLRFFDRNTSGLSLGIEAFGNLVVAPKEMLLYMGPKGTGKTWFCTHVGVEALMQRERVLHVSLEMDEPYITARYYQRIFAAGNWSEDRYNRTYLEFDQLRRLSGFRTRSLTPRWDFSDSGARRELMRKLKPWGARFGNLFIKYFPSGQLTVPHFAAFLDYLELEEKFIPTVLIVDYPDLFNLDPKNLRIATGRVFVDLRGIAGDRNMKLICPTQGGRQTIGAKRNRSSDTAEDISKVFTADHVITYQRTEAEERLGLARLSLEHARNTATGRMAVITQAYATGQYVLQSAIMQDSYWQKMQELESASGNRD